MLMPEVSSDQVPANRLPLSSETLLPIFLRPALMFLQLFVGHSPILGSQLELHVPFQGRPHVYLWLCCVLPCDPGIAPRS
jgi:hypothetical protein